MPLNVLERAHAVFFFFNDYGSVILLDDSSQEFVWLYTEVEWVGPDSVLILNKVTNVTLVTNA